MITDMNWWKEIPHVSTVITMQVSSEKELQVLSIIQEKKLKALNVIMKHQTGRTFDEFQKNPNLEKAVAIIRIDLNEYSCKKHI